MYAPNPLVDDARQARPALYAAAMSEAPAPTLFASGDVPVFIASGAEPSVLLELPWQARHAGAAADAPTLARMLESYAGDGWNTAVMNHGNDRGNSDYRARVNSWLSGPPTEFARLDEMTPARQRASDETYDQLFGARDAYKAAEAAQVEEARAAEAKYQDEKRERARQMGR